MMLVGASVGAVLFAYYVPQVGSDYFRGAVVAGSTWFGINVVFDLIALVAAFGMPAGAWAIGIGARYLTLPITGAAIGYVASMVGTGNPTQY